MLSVRTGPQAGQAFELGERTRIGRSSDNEICLQGAKLSRHHALFERTSEGLHLTDLGSTNGTWVNGERITGTVPLEAGASISIGDVQCTLRSDG
jgi:pSer/pThr/pTyr-binding forkhead associated (FHA) protein